MASIIPVAANSHAPSASLARFNPAPTRLDLAVILPTYNERENVPEVIARLEAALDGIAWEAIFVDDDSPDGTAEAVLSYAQQDPRIRLIQRVHRRGLASACIEGMMATSASFLAVMDADLQHDETILPQMLTRLRQESLDIVVGTRNAQGGSMGDFRRSRVLLSRIGKKISHSVCCCELTDPMSGFFMLRRRFFNEVVRDLQGGGFKILVDLLATCPRPVRLAEIGYTFGVRRHGESKLDVVVGIEYLSFILNKRLGAVLPVQLTLYVLVGALGLATHLVSLLILTHLYRVQFVPAQIASTFLAMTENFLLNNMVTYRNRRFRGPWLIAGFARFTLACSFGAWANVIFARALLQSGAEWYLAGLAGIVLGSVWNLSISSLFTWQAQRRANPAFVADEAEAFATDFKVSP